MTDRFEKVVVGSGHMIDAPDRAMPRFPEAKAETVRTEIGRQLDRWKIGAADLAICGGACGADVLFGEESLRRGAHLRLLLAQERDGFVRDSVEQAGADWVRRFDELCRRAEVETLPEAPQKSGDDLSIYERVNLWIVERARRAAAEGSGLFALLVWDEKASGDGPGGTSDFAKKIREAGGEVAIINPTKL